MGYIWIRSFIITVHAFHPFLLHVDAGGVEHAEEVIGWGVTLVQVDFLLCGALLVGADFPLVHPHLVVLELELKASNLDLFFIKEENLTWICHLKKYHRWNALG